MGQVNEVSIWWTAEEAAEVVSNSGFTEMIADLTVLAVGFNVLVIEVDGLSRVGPWICGEDGWAWKPNGDVDANFH